MTFILRAPRLIAGLVLAIVASLTLTAAPANAAMSTENTQWNLAGLGFLEYSGVDGSYGPGTTAAVRLFQSKEGLGGNGANTDATSNCLMLMMKRVQAKVGANQDGYNGPNTKAAIIRYQQANGLQADGKAGPGTHAKMGLKYENACAAVPPPPSPTTSRQHIVDVAMKYKDQTRSQFDPTYTKFAGRHLSDSWCQDFAWFVWRTADVKGTDAMDRGAPIYKSNAVSSFIRYGQAHGTIVNGIGNAQIGDMIVWSNGDGSGRNHVAVVVGRNANGTLRTMNGNATVKGINKVWLNEADDGQDPKDGTAVYVRPVL